MKIYLWRTIIQWLGKQSKAKMKHNFMFPTNSPPDLSLRECGHQLSLKSRSSGNPNLTGTRAGWEFRQREPSSRTKGKYTYIKTQIKDYKSQQRYLLSRKCSWWNLMKNYELKYTSKIVGITKTLEDEI